MFTPSCNYSKQQQPHSVSKILEMTGSQNDGEKTWPTMKNNCHRNREVMDRYIQTKWKQFIYMDLSIPVMSLILVLIIFGLWCLHAHRETLLFIPPACMYDSIPFFWLLHCICAGTFRISHWDLTCSAVRVGKPVACSPQTRIGQPFNVLSHLNF